MEKIKGRDRPLLLGVTGGIASGKSTVSGMLVEMGAFLIDFDVLARQVVEPGKPAWKEIVGYFGREVLRKDDHLDRKRLSDVVFQDVEKRKKLEGFTHPRILEEFHRLVDEIAAKQPAAVIQAAVPLLMELNLRSRFHKVLLVHVPRGMQIDRLMKRDGISREAAENILKAQMPLDDKLEYADYIVNNQGSIQETKKQVEAVWEALKEAQGAS